MWEMWIMVRLTKIIDFSQKQKNQLINLVSVLCSAIVGSLENAVSWEKHNIELIICQQECLRILSSYPSPEVIMVHALKM